MSGPRRRGRSATAPLLLVSSLCACAAAEPQPGSAVTSPTTRVWPVMGTLLEVTVWEAAPERARAAIAAARAAVFRVDSLMSLYKPESEISTVNRRAGTDSVTSLSPETAEVLAAALQYAARTHGALDVTVAPVVAAWGFYRHEGRIPSPAALDSARRLVGVERVAFDPVARTVRLPRAGMRLDFGAIAKGYAVDRAVSALRGAGIRQGMVDLGGNLRVFGRPPEGSEWRIGLRDPRAPEAVFAVVGIDSGAVATSGDYEQFFEHDGIRYSHIFDPRTGWPVRGVASASVLAPTGTMADALSTALFVLGPEVGCALAAGMDGVQVVWVKDPGPADAARTAAVGPGVIVVTPGAASVLELRLPAPAVSAPWPVRSCGARGRRSDDGPPEFRAPSPG